MMRLSLIFLLHLRLPHSPPYSHLWLSEDTNISTFQYRLVHKKCMPWDATLTRVLSWTFPFLHCHLLHHHLYRTSVNSEGISIRG